METFIDFLKFNAWANERLIENLRKSKNVDSENVRILGHLLLAEREWLERCQKTDSESSGRDFWSIEDIDACDELYKRNLEDYKEYFATIDDQGLSKMIKYQNSEGENHSNTIREIMIHVFFHSAQHRGQIVKSIRENGDSPTYTDYIGYLRH